MTSTQTPPPVTRPIPETDAAACAKYHTHLCRACEMGAFGQTCYCYCECPDNRARGGSYDDPFRPERKTCKHKHAKRQAASQKRIETRANARREADKLAAKAQGNISRLFPAPAAKPAPTIDAGRLAWLELV